MDKCNYCRISRGVNQAACSVNAKFAGLSAHRQNSINFKQAVDYIPRWLYSPYGWGYDGGWFVYRDAPIKCDSASAKVYTDYVNRHRNDPGFDESIYSKNPANMYSNDNVYGYNVLRPIDVKANYGNKVKKSLIKRRMPNGSQFLTHFLIGMRNAIAHPSNAATAGVNAINRSLPFLRGESGTYVKDLSGSRIARVMPDTKGVKSILGNMFIEQDNANTIRPASEFKRASRSTPIGDRRIPLSNYKLFIGVVDGKLKVDSLNHFSDSDVVTPVVNKTEIAHSLKRQSAAAVVDYAIKDRMWRQDPLAGVPAAAVADSVAKYSNLSSSEVGFVNGRGLFIPSTSLKRDKSLLVSPNGNSLFINNMGNLSPRQDSLVNDFLRRNGGAYPVQLDNGRYSHFLDGDGTTYDKYMSSDLYRAPESVWAFGEVQ